MLHFLYLLASVSSALAAFSNINFNSLWIPETPCFYKVDDTGPLCPDRVGIIGQMWRYFWAGGVSQLAAAGRVSPPVSVCFRESVWSVLTGHGQETPLPSILLHDVREIETWILRLLSAPVPVPGKTRVEVSGHALAGIPARTD